MDKHSVEDYDFSTQLVGNVLVISLSNILYSLIINVVWAGCVFSLLWNWFLVPLKFPSLPLPLAIGIALMLGLLPDRMSRVNRLLQRVMSKQDEYSVPAKFPDFKIIFSQSNVFENFGGGLTITIILFFGYIVHLFV